MESPLIECVANFSEGRNDTVIKSIVDAIGSVSDTRVLHVDQGYDAHRTVITFVSSPESIVSATYAGIAQAVDKIDMRRHSGEHPRLGAADVIPFIPLQSSNINDCITLSKTLAKQVAEAFELPVYLYAYSASIPGRRELADVRRGEYEYLATRLDQHFDCPDFGPCHHNEKSGATIIGARDIMVAINIGLDTKDVKIAQNIAKVVRERSSRIVDENGKVRYQAGLFKGLRAKGWWMQKYNCAQVTMNILDTKTAPLVEVFKAIEQEAAKYAVKILGSELIGLISEKCFKDIDNDIKVLRLDAFKTFEPHRHIIERLLQNY